MKTIIIFFFVFIIGFSISINGQSNIVEVNYIEKGDSLIFVFFNNYSDTLYLFSTYFCYSYLTSNLTHKINQKERIYKVSFLPFLQYIEICPSNLFITDENKITHNKQNCYQFIELLPNDTLSVSIFKNFIFHRTTAKNNAVKDFDNENFKPKRLKKITLAKQKGIYDLIFEFAVYRNVNFLLCENEYVKSGNQGYEKTKDYFVVTTSPVLNWDYSKSLILRVQ